VRRIPGYLCKVTGKKKEKGEEEKREIGYFERAGGPSPYRGRKGEQKAERRWILFQGRKKKRGGKKNWPRFFLAFEEKEIIPEEEKGRRGKRKGRGKFFNVLSLPTRIPHSQD